MSEYDKIKTDKKKKLAVQKSLEDLFQKVVASIDGMINEFEEEGLSIENISDAHTIVRAKIDKDLSVEALSVLVKIVVNTGQKFLDPEKKPLDNIYRSVGEDKKIAIRVVRFVDRVSVLIYVDSNKTRWT